MSHELTIRANGFVDTFAREVVRRANWSDQVLARALRALVDRCDGAEGVRADGSNIDTSAAHAALGGFDAQN